MHSQGTTDQDRRGRLGENILHYKPRFVLLQNNAIWFEKYRSPYQRLVNHTFHPQIGRNVEVYVDDMSVKSAREIAFGQPLRNLRYT